MGHAWLAFLLAWAIVIAIISLLSVIQESCPGRGSGRFLRWLWLTSIGATLLGGLSLLAFGFI